MAAPPPPRTSATEYLHSTTPVISDRVPVLSSPKETANNADIKDGLVPLPTDFDPARSTEADDVQMVDRYDTKATSTRHRLASELGHESGVYKVIELQKDNLGGQYTLRDGRTASTPEAVETIEDKQEVNDPDLMVILQSLQASREEEAEDKDEPMETALSSPLSDLPDLPTELPPSPTLITGSSSASSPLFPIKRSQSPRSVAPYSETSTIRHRTGSSPKPSGGKRLRPDRIAHTVAVSAASEDQSETRRLDTGTKAKSDRHRAPESNTSREDSKDDVSSFEGDRSNLTENEEPRKTVKRRKVSEGKPVRPKSRKLLDQVLGIGRDGDAPTEKIAPRAKVFNDAQLKLSLTGKTTEIQVAPCLRPRYAKWGKCTQCVSKVGGDACRFRDYRVFKIDPKTTDILGPGWFQSTDWKDATTPLPRDFNAPLTETHMKRIEQIVAPLLLPLITREMRHVFKNKAIKRGIDAAKHRAVCDFCSSTIFGGWFFCKKCGRDYCLHCERYFADDFERMGESPWHLPDAARPRLLRCVIQSDMPASKTGGRSPAFHFRTDLQPVSRFSEEELKSHWLSLAQFALLSEGSVGERLKLLGLYTATDEVIGQMQDWVAALPISTASTEIPITEEEMKMMYTKSTRSSAKIPDPAELEEKTMKFAFIDNEELTLQLFDQLWHRGEPIVVDRVGEKLKMSWTPDDFIHRFGNEKCVLVDCQKNTSEVETVQRFFELFKDRGQRSSQILKLKDWPTTDDFANTHPDLYNDFSNALPVPDFTRRDGVLNLYAHFPPGPTRPDIGPKMYNAFEAVETRGGHGSTRLHMDVADAVNLMLHASPRGDGSHGCAVWDLFRAEDSDRIRLYLKRKFDGTHQFTDPIHSQLFYLDSEMRKELNELYGVASWRIYQYPGQAVFIPAGCAHQVCNLADCIKIALDFVSTHNVSRCQQLTQDFRTENFVKVWKDDVLQLYNVLWYAWTNVQETRERRSQRESLRKVEARSRAARLASLQNGDHEQNSPTSPFPAFTGLHRHGVLSPNISSIRDETRTPSSTLPSGANSPQSVVNVDAGGAEVDSDGGPEEGGPSPCRAFAERLLLATLAASEPAPPPEARDPSSATKWGSKIPLKSVTRKERTSNEGRVPRPTRVKASQMNSRGPVGADGGDTPIKTSITSQLIRSGGLPIDLAVSAARLQMGEGADGEELDGGKREEMNEGEVHQGTLRLDKYDMDSKTYEDSPEEEDV